MRWEVMVDEELSVHQEEGEVVDSPEDNEETGIVPEAVANLVRDRVEVAAPSDEVGTENADENRQRNGGGPPANKVTDEVNLFLGLIVGPKADAGKQEGTVDGVAGIGV